MSLVGFRAQNHPQQETKDEVDNRAITDADFAPLHERFRFTIDAAASAENAKLPRYWTREDDALRQSWAGERVWCNPPFSNIQPWAAKAAGEWAIRWSTWEWGQPKGWPGPQLIVMLLPANRTEQAWWQDIIEPPRRVGWPRGIRVEFLRGRMRFDRPDAVIGPKGDRPPFGCCLAIWGMP